MKLTGYAVFDFDGTIILRKGEEEAVNPYAICLLRGLLEKKIYPIILTGRPCRDASLILNVLSNEGIVIKRKDVICRDAPISEVEWKKDAFHSLLQSLSMRSLEILEYHDDNLSVLEAMGKVIESICLIYYIDGTPVVIRKTDRCFSQELLESCEKEKSGIY